MKKSSTNLFSFPVEIQELFDIFHNQIRLVGGCVRDRLRQKPIHDYDFATPLSPESIIDILKKNQIPFFDTGLKHGTVTALYKKTPYEITTLRCDIQTNGRHAEVCFVDSYEQDAHRRDFTMNALYQDNTGQIFDYVGGQADIQNRCVRFIGMPEKRVQEDFLRILRYFRFLADVGTQQIHLPSLEACGLYKTGLKNISIERIRDEMMRLLDLLYAPDSLRLMDKKGILSLLFPAYHLEELVRFLNIYPTATVLEKWAILVPNADKLNWKWSRAQKKEFQKLYQPVQITEDIQQTRYLLWQLGHSAFLFHLAKAQLNQKISSCFVEKAKCLEMPVFPITGADFAQIGFQGIQIKENLKIAESEWVKMNFPSEKKLVIDSVLSYNKRKG